MKKTKIINFFGGPGIGKSTNSVGVVYYLKALGYNVEFASEAAKDLLYDGKLETTDQKDIFHEQYKRVKRLADAGVQYVVTDSPLLLSLIYGNDPDEDFKKQIIDLYKSFDNINFVLDRSHPYVELGRIHSEMEAHEIDEKIRTLLDKLGEVYFLVNSNLSGLFVCLLSILLSQQNTLPPSILTHIKLVTNLDFSDVLVNYLNTQGGANARAKSRRTP